MEEKLKGKLKISKRGTDNVTYQVEYITKNGKLVSSSPRKGTLHFKPDDACPDIEVDIELGKDGQPSKVTIPGKPQVQPQSTQDTRDNQRTLGPNAASRAPANMDATAPYNFITAQDPLGFDTTPTGTRFSGTLSCSLKALTPLLVAGPQAINGKGPTERRFFEVAGIPTIPGSSLKGMIRTVIEILACAPLAEGLSSRAIAYRDVASNNQHSGYWQRFRGQSEELCAGFLMERGSERTVTPCEFVRFDSRTDKPLRIPDPSALSALEKYNELITKRGGCVSIKFNKEALPSRSGVRSDSGTYDGHIVFTGGIAKKSLDYIFYNKHKTLQIPVEDKVWSDFIAQLSATQKELLFFLRKQYKGALPIFFLRKKTSTNDGPITAIGLARYFRIVAPTQPRTIAQKLKSGIGLPERMFGSISREGGISTGGRVRFHAAKCVLGEKGEAPAAVRFPKQGYLVAGTPSPTAVTLYLEQDPHKVSFRESKISQNENLSTFASLHPVLRGRKLYWHRRIPFSPEPPNDNPNVHSCYFPLAESAEFTFTVTFERLDRVELGALCEAIQLPQESAHKLGLGKPFGLGSVRVEIDLTKTHIQADDEKYRSLRARFGSSIDSRDLIDGCRQHFRSEICRLRNASDFESLQHVKDFRIMTSFTNLRDPDSIKYMSLNDGSVFYTMKPILKKPSDIRSTR